MGIKLIENGRITGKIIVSPKATQQERYAATELRYYFNMMTAQPAEVAHDAEGGVIIIGSALPFYGERPENYGTEELRWYTNNGKLFIDGGKRGVIYAAYDFLESIGCRFFAANAEKVPTYTDLEIEDSDVRDKPRFEFRDHNYHAKAQNPRLAVKQRLTGALGAIPEEYGGYMPYAMFVHTFEGLLPPSKYAAEHPEYYALLENGERPTLPGRFQLCLSNPDVLREVTNNVRERLRANPNARIMSISQNDWGGNCRCENCRRIDEEEGSPSGTLLRFVNAIAEELEEEFPDVIFDTLAYMYTRTAPKITKPRHNVCVRLCSIECCFSHPFETCDDYSRGILKPDGTRSRFIEDLHDWGKICNRIYIWDYTTCFAHYPTPHPNWHTLQPNMITFAENGVQGVFEQANGSSRGGCDLNEMRMYVISKLLWNPWCDMKKHMREFAEFYYGDAADEIIEYTDTLCQKCEDDNIHVGFNDAPKGDFVNEEMLEIYNEILDRAMAKVQGDPIRMMRIDKIRLGLRYVKLKRGVMLRHEHPTEEINRFFTDWKAHGLYRMEEWFNPDTSLRTFCDEYWRGESYYTHWAEEGGERF